jgi:ABC-type branched-subunit amino acid transport system ATPase component
MLGGAGTLTGPIVGAMILVPASEVFKNAFKEAHPLIYGTLIVLVVLFLPEGIVGTVARTWQKVRGASAGTSKSARTSASTASTGTSASIGTSITAGTSTTAGAPTSTETSTTTESTTAAESATGATRIESRSSAAGAPENRSGQTLPPILSVEHISKRFGGLRAVNDVSLAVARSEVLFIVGPNGAGKTTLFNLISGFLPPDAGTIEFDGRPLHRIAPHDAARRGIGRTFQIVKPLRNLTVLENVMLGAFLHTRDVAKAAERAREVLAFLQMEAVAALPAQGLPLATLKRLEIARALATRPKLILLDEVVAGLPTGEAMALAALLQRLPEWGVSAVAGVEHVMQVVMRVAQRVIVIDRGAVIAEGKPDEVVRRSEVIEAYLGTKYRQVTG